MSEKITPEMARRALIARGALKEDAAQRFGQEVGQAVGPEVEGFLSDIPGALLNVLSKHFQSEGVPASVTQFSKGAGLGATQGLSDIALSVANLGLENKITHPNILNHSPESIYESLGQGLGQVIAPLAIPGGSAYAASRIPPNVLSKILLGSGLGAAEGYATNEENRPLGAVLGGLTGASSSAINTLNSLRSKKIAEKIVTSKVGKMGEYDKLYSNLFGKEAEIKLRTPSINAEKIIKHSSSEYNAGLKKFLKDPTLRNAQDAQSDMGKLVSYYKKLAKSKPLTSSKLETIRAAEDAQKRLRGSIAIELEKIKPGKAEEYARITHGYKNEVIPYTRQKAITEFQEGKLEPKELVRDLLQDKKFMAQISKNNPELRTRKFIDATKNNKIAMAILTALGAGAAGALGFYETSKALR